MTQNDWIFPVAEGVALDAENGRWSEGAFFDDEDIPVEWHRAEPSPHVRDRQIWCRWLEYLETSPQAAQDLLIVAKNRARTRLRKEERETHSSADPPRIAFTGGGLLTPTGTLLDFWQWAFSDLCDDDIKGIFAEWMVGSLLGLHLTSARRISWADSDIVLPNGTRIEVKATAVWQSWKLINPDGTVKPRPKIPVLDRARIRFGGLRARSGDSQWSGDRVFKSDYYVFCFQAETDPAKWDAWNLAQWEFYMMGRAELLERNVGRSISLATLHSAQEAMSATEFQSFARSRLGISSG